MFHPRTLFRTSQSGSVAAVFLEVPDSCLTKWHADGVFETRLVGVHKVSRQVSLFRGEKCYITV